jgi:hypothetical protein
MRLKEAWLALTLSMLALILAGVHRADGYCGEVSGLPGISKQCDGFFSWDCMYGFDMCQTETCDGRKCVPPEQGGPISFCICPDYWCDPFFRGCWGCP